MNRRQFISGLLASGFAAAAHSSAGVEALPRPLPGGFDILPANGAAPTSMVVLLHGFGGNAESLRATAEIWARALPQTVFVLPDAPEQCRDNTDPASRQWFGIRALETDDAARVAQIRAMSPRLDEHIDAKLSQYGLNDDQLAIAGISQGAMMAVHCGLRRPRRCAAVVSYNGMLVDIPGLARDRITRPPVFAGHGAEDNVVPYTRLAELAEALRRHQVLVQTATYPLGHSVNDEGLRDGADFIRRGLDAARRRPFFEY
jgi:phospholipase/carboxylesterase